MLQNAALKSEQKKDGHKIPNKLEYMDELAQLSNFEPFPIYYKEILKKWYPEYDGNQLEICEKRIFTFPSENNTEWIL